MFSGWNADIPGLMRQEARAFIDDVIWNGDGTMARAVHRAVHVRERDAGAVLRPARRRAAAASSRCRSTPSQRGGVLTQGGLMSLLAKPNQTSPVHRGKFVREQVFCQLLQPPPPDIEIVPPELSRR